MRIKINDSGFTFLQLLVGLAILVALSVIGVPGLTVFMQDSRLKSSAENFYTDMQWARAEAVRNNTDVYVDLRSGSSWCYGFKKGSSCNCNIAGDCSEKSINSTTNGSVVMNVSGITGNTIKFNSGRGTVDGQSGAAVFSIGSRTVNVEINPVGRVRICSGVLSGYKPCVD
jgi:type IV fimbrial biogenesis protein FimT